MHNISLHGDCFCCCSGTFDGTTGSDHFRASIYPTADDDATATAASLNSGAATMSFGIASLQLTVGLTIVLSIVAAQPSAGELNASMQLASSHA